MADGSVPSYLVPGPPSTAWAASVPDNRVPEVGPDDRVPAVGPDDGLGWLYGWPSDHRSPQGPPGYGPLPGHQPPVGHVPRPVQKSTLALVALVALFVGVLWLGGLGSVGLFGVADPSYDVHAQNRAEGPPPLPVPVDPDSPYPVYGSQDMVKYLAQSMIKHEVDIDLRAYQLDDSAQAIDAVLEAIAQNPYVIDVQTYGCDPGSCQIGYGYSAAEQAAVQQQLLEAVTTILAETVDESMTDVEKVVAINGWLTKNARYDTEAAAQLPDEPEKGFVLPREYLYAWNASGVLLDGKGVCESYAEAFHLLANAAGVPTVVVSGNLLEGDVPHAWNKAYVDGQWKAVDVTWNDGPPTTTDYLLINDSEFTAEAARLEDARWMADDLIASYATP